MDTLAILFLVAGVLFAIGAKGLLFPQRDEDEEGVYYITDEEIEAERERRYTPHEHTPYQAPGQWPMCEWCYNIVPEVFAAYDKGYLEYICHYCNTGGGFRRLTEEELQEAMRYGRILAGVDNDA